MAKQILASVLVVVLALVPAQSFAHQADSEGEGDGVNCTIENLGCAVMKANSAGDQLQNLVMPKVTAPVPPAPVARSQTVTYSVQTKGTITADLAEFKAQANATLNDPRGWARMGVQFQEVASGGSFILVLSEASQVPTFSPGCDSEYSCNAGRYVIINQTRWLNATGPWNNGGGSLRDYRHMVVNHETGHWLGHGHEHCKGAGQPALVMQQQSINLEGCTFNPWPTASELWSTTLGIKL